jgi:hypothetical protein
MQFFMRKLLCKLFVIILFLITNVMPVYSFEIYDLNGNWLSHRMMQWYSELVNSPDPKKVILSRVSLKTYSWGEGVTWSSDTIIEIDPKQADGYNGSYNDFDLRCSILSLRKLNDNEFEFYLVSDSSTRKLKSLIHFYDEDTISISVEWWDDTWGPWGKNKIWHRFSGPARMPIQEAVINSTKVRLCTSPDISSDTWTYLNTGDAIRILDRSPEKMKIDDMEAYWYKVRSGKHPDGWVYGAYVWIFRDCKIF